MSFQKIYGFEVLGLSEVQLSISELSVVGGGWVVDKRTSWSDLVGVRQKRHENDLGDSGGPLVCPLGESSSLVLAGVTSWGQGCGRF